jgi:hypothetical protein
LFQFFCELQYIPQESIHVFKTLKKTKKTYTLLDFNTQMSFNTTIVLNL